MVALSGTLPVLVKTLTSFKAARLATELDFIDKVFFVVDRKDLDYQTMKEYQRFFRQIVLTARKNTAGLKRNSDKDDNKNYRHHYSET
ncbi:DEAD/DEAH box helicase family protein [Escherichia coli]